MTPGAIFWVVLFAAAAGLFFGIALVVSIRGLGDLRHLLSTSKTPSEERVR
jgi:hypothetical protein